ncbi:hypothetical protein HELRODRAFT_163938 [Helobdella robusta]|uniref:Uncharacterized protein n=1 Tax=Helobdella robusta TaxID=6412 RepID=T1EUM8_HELRO|nr:hypothetical protein HELRODRAFT_163938 [Helobdella robusta]ESN94156.1 hypothetical protein HELRODRAFT_163938 [Helobdella robusta]
MSSVYVQRFQKIQRAELKINDEESAKQTRIWLRNAAETYFYLKMCILLCSRDDHVCMKLGVVVNSPSLLKQDHYSGWYAFHTVTSCHLEGFWQAWILLELQDLPHRQLFRELDALDQAVVRPVLKNNCYFAHAENIFLAAAVERTIKDVSAARCKVYGRKSRHGMVLQISSALDIILKSSPEMNFVLENPEMCVGLAAATYCDHTEFSDNKKLSSLKNS